MVELIQSELKGIIYFSKSTYDIYLIRFKFAQSCLKEDKN